MMLDPVHLTTFQTVITDGSFEAAARSLHVTPSAVSQRIKALEQTVGQVLVRRAKPCEPTDAGLALVRLAGQVSLLEREALDAARGPLGGGHTRTTVSVVVNADSLTWFLSALATLPTELALSFDLQQDDQDHTATLLRAGTAMAAVTAQRVAVQGCQVERLGAMRYLAVAAPALHSRYFAAPPTQPPEPTEPVAPTAPGAGAIAAFGSAPMLALNRKDKLQHRFLGGLTRRRLEPPLHYVPSSWGFVEAIRLGLGWGLVPESIARADIASGVCVDLTPGRHIDVPLYWQYWRLESTVLTALTAAVRATAALTLR